MISYYDPLIAPQNFAEHYFWANFLIRPIDMIGRGHYLAREEGIEALSKLKGFDLSPYKLTKNLKEKLLRNCVEPETGKRILECVIDPIKFQKELNF